MPVLDHEVHESVRHTDDKRYGCHNRGEFKEEYRSPRRYQTSDGYKAVFMYDAEPVEFRMSRECRYDRSLQDPWCAECNHRGSGEAYDARIRELASVK